MNKSPHLEMELRRALEQEEFRLYYQPKVNLETGMIEGMEALIRWKHPEKGLIPPVEFISFAERSGLIIPIGEWVLRTACLQNREWMKAGLSPVVMSVNLSVRQLYQPNLIDVVWKVLKETGLPPKYLELEITESMTMDKDQVLNIVKGLKQLGVQISLDDFGTGYSSLHYLNDFPIDKIKIDQSFIRNCTSDTSNAAIVKMIIAMAHHLKMNVVAEGIETKDDLIFLQQNFCNHGQGYLFSRPLPPEELIQSFHQIEQIVLHEGIPQEIYNQKLMQEALENTRRELRDVMRQQQGMIFKLIKENDRFIHTLCDGKLLYRMGFTPEQVIKREPKDIFPADIVEEITKYYLRAWEGEENVTYYGEISGIYYFASLSPIRKAGKVEGIIGSCIDITEQKKAEKALKLSESKYQIIAENMLDLVVILDPKGVVLYASPSYEKVLGFSPEEYVGNQASTLIHPEDVPSIRTQYATMIQSKTPCQVEFRCRRANDGWMTIEAQMTPVFDEHAEVEYLIVVGRNISERIRTEELTRKSEKLSVVRHLASSVAHEIRSPLTTIKGFVQLLQKEVDHPFYIGMVLSEANRLERIVSEFLTLAKPQIRQLKETNLILLLKQVIEQFNEKAILNHVEIVQEYDIDTPTIYCDGNQIKQVFMHILQNAVEAMPNEGIIKIQLFKHGSNDIIIRFIDHGVGISEERMKKVGEPFYSTKEKGTGLGLMVCYKIIQEHGGTIDIKSAINQGTTVDVILPIKHSITIGDG